MQPSVEINNPSELIQVETEKRQEIGQSGNPAQNVEKSAINSGRDPVTGKFLAGNKGGGRPATRLISEAYKEILARDGAEAYAEVIAKDAKTAKRASSRLAAVQEITDRTEGKAVQTINQRGVFLVAAPGEDVLEQVFGRSMPEDE